MPKTIPLCGDKRGCKWFLQNGCGSKTGMDNGDAVYHRHVLFGCSAYEETPLDKVGEFMEWYKKLMPQFGTVHSDNVEAKLRELFGGQE